ncbi:2-succinyl-6-hydroxy-2,4-cyclohexadiene-1-carboxylate synthase [Adlercreutzia caecimuris B7]|uniref:2-succinyl-6-hydroxy-2, 4-cyclohexadiene-1-carboxylate synthase n=1 Tax=Adlercreutzia caecimuris B7 TaxID=1235794 RepID=R9L2R5_9ACTN|nr:2-succinyl-6-hydroxy-2,4-cyclohexadiene-1-carboxylate synthase [Adlercreutzia caecimuris B7]
MREEENAVPEGQRKAPAAGLGWRKESVAGRPEKAPVILLHGFAQTPASWDGVARILQGQGRRTYAPNLFEPESGLALRACDCGEALTAPGDAAYDRAGGPTGDLAADPARDVADSPTSDPINHPIADKPTSDPASHPTSHSVADPLASMGAVCDRVAAIVRLVAAAEGAPVLVGYSMGGRIAAETMVRHPGLPLAGLVLESAGLGPADDAARAALARRNGEWAARLREGGVAAFMDWWETLPLFASQRELPPATRAAIRIGREAHGAETLARSLEAWGAHHQAAESETVAALAQMRVADRPVLYLAGSRDEKYAALAARVRAAGLPAMLVEGAGHNVHLEKPEVFSRAVAQLAGAPPSGPSPS